MCCGSWFAGTRNFARKIFRLAQAVTFVAAFRGRKFTLGITYVQIMIEKAQPNPYSGDSNQLSPIPILVGR